MGPGLEPGGEGPGGGEIGVTEGVLERELDRLGIRGGSRRREIKIGPPPGWRAGRAWVVKIGGAGGSFEAELLVVLEELVGLEGRREGK